MLKYIKTEKCPICGCELIKSENVEVDSFNKNKYREHCNGGRWETRTFSCGYRIEYCPNFSSEEIKGECTNNAEYLQKSQDRVNFKEAVIALK